jgi:hypothetical protein
VTYEDDWFDGSLPVGLAVWIAGLAIGLTVSETWTARGDYALVVGVAGTWAPAAIAVMRRFPSRHAFGRLFGMLGTWLAPVIPLSRALPESWSIAGRGAVVGLAGMCIAMIYAVAVGPGPKTRAADAPPVVPR